MRDSNVAKTQFELLLEEIRDVRTRVDIVNDKLDSKLDGLDERLRKAEATLVAIKSKVAVYAAIIAGALTIAGNLAVKLLTG